MHTEDIQQLTVTITRREQEAPARKLAKRESPVFHLNWCMTFQPPRAKSPTSFQWEETASLAEDGNWEYLWRGAQEAMKRAFTDPAITIMGRDWQRPAPKLKQAKVLAIIEQAATRFMAIQETKRRARLNRILFWRGPLARFAIWRLNRRARKKGRRVMFGLEK